jgi:hypothetical protein
VGCAFGTREVQGEQKHVIRDGGDVHNAVLTFVIIILFHLQGMMMKENDIRNTQKPGQK